jgi:hypothetical protein
MKILKRMTGFMRNKRTDLRWPGNLQLNFALSILTWDSDPWLFDLSRSLKALEWTLGCLIISIFLSFFFSYLLCLRYPLSRFTCVYHFLLLASFFFFRGRRVRTSKTGLFMKKHDLNLCSAHLTLNLHYRSKLIGRRPIPLTETKFAIDIDEMEVRIFRVHYIARGR